MSAPEDALEYLREAIKRIGSGNVSSLSGSHVAGILGKAANGFEKEVRSYTDRLLQLCQLDYDTMVRPKLHGEPPFTKLTLGMLREAIREAAQLAPGCVSPHVPGGLRLKEFTDGLRRVNQAWVELKHGDKVQPTLLAKRIIEMLRLFEAIRLWLASPDGAF